MKEYARFLAKRRVPVVRTQSRSDTPQPDGVAPDLPPQSRPRPFDRRSRKASRERSAHGTHGTHVANQAGAEKSLPLKDLAQRNAHPHDVTAIPDSWGPAEHHRAPSTATPAAKEVSAPQRQSVAETKQRPGPKRKLKHKRRRQAMSMSVSEEEEFILRTYAAKRNMSFSAWARQTLFRSMGRKIPDRS